jgi:hypothetical protein
MHRDLKAVAEHYLIEWGSAGWAHAFHSLIELGPCVLPELESRFSETNDDRLRAELIEIARRLRADSALSFFAAALRDRAPVVWKAALDGLVDLGTDEALRTLEDCMSDAAREQRGEEWKAWVIEAIGQIKEARIEQTLSVASRDSSRDCSDGGAHSRESDDEIS